MKQSHFQHFQTKYPGTCRAPCLLVENFEKVEVRVEYLYNKVIFNIFRQSASGPVAHHACWSEISKKLKSESNICITKLFSTFPNKVPREQSRTVLVGSVGEGLGAFVLNSKP